jgi:hypothetical protein
LDEDFEDKLNLCQKAQAQISLRIRRSSWLRCGSDRNTIHTKDMKR